jgi:hypothetical protein
MIDFIKDRFISIKDPVSGVLRVTACSYPPSDGALYCNCSIIGIVISKEFKAMPFQRHFFAVSIFKWPSEGMELPVLIDRQRPTRIKILWDKIESNKQQAIRQARQAADDWNRNNKMQ